MTRTSSDNNYLYNKRLKSKAQSLRASMTKAEACLWKYVLRGRRLQGFQFRRQRPVLNYIADFMCKELNFIIEVDGITHTYENVAEADVVKQKELEDAGFLVIRFTDDDILGNIDHVRAYLEDLIENNKNSTPAPRQRGTMKNYASFSS